MPRNDDKAGHADLGPAWLSHLPADQPPPTLPILQLGGWTSPHVQQASNTHEATQGVWKRTTPQTLQVLLNLDKTTHLHKIHGRYSRSTSQNLSHYQIQSRIIGYMSYLGCPRLLDHVRIDFTTSLKTTPRPEVWKHQSWQYRCKSLHQPSDSRLITPPRCPAGSHLRCKFKGDSARLSYAAKPRLLGNLRSKTLGPPSATRLFFFPFPLFVPSRSRKHPSGVGKAAKREEARKFDIRI